jgi:hypothetical protein
MDASGPFCTNEGTFVMLASELRRHPHPNSYYHLNPMHIAKSERLSERLDKESYIPWDNKFRLEAVISQKTWAKRDRDSEGSIEFGNRRSYTHLKFDDYGSSEVHITEGIPFLDFAKSRDVELSWVVVDVLVGNRRYIDMRAKHVEHKEAYRILSKPRRLSKWLVSSPLKEHHHNELINVCQIEALAKAFAPLIQRPLLWPRLKMSMFSDMRKCWCFEVSSSECDHANRLELTQLQEIANYLQHMTHQYDEMTLNGNPYVKPFIDPESLLMLESRAPMLSIRDKAEILELFKERKLFPGLEDGYLRTQVEIAVCKQGPILSCATLAVELHVLVSKIHKPLSKLEGVMGEMQNDVEDTVRLRVMTYFERLIPKPLQTSKFRRGNASSASCYETLFINLLRGNYKRLVEQDLIDIVTGGHSNNRRDMVVPIKSDEINDLSKRHGTQLFKRQTVKSSLHWGEDYRCSSILRASSIARCLTCIFLFGEPTWPKNSKIAGGSGADDVAYLGDLPWPNEEPEVIPNLKEVVKEVVRREGTMVSRVCINSWRAQVEHHPHTSRSSSRVSRKETTTAHNVSPQCTKRPYSATPTSPTKYRRLIPSHPREQYAESTSSASAIPHQERTPNFGGQDLRLTPHSPPDNSSVYSTTSPAQSPRPSTLSGLTVCNEVLRAPSAALDWDGGSTSTAVSRQNRIDGGNVSVDIASSGKFGKERAIESKRKLGPLPFQLYGTKDIYIIDRTKEDVERFLENQPNGTTFSCEIPVRVPDSPIDPDYPPETKTFSNFPSVVDNLLDGEARIGHILLSIGPVAVRTTTETWVPSNSI